MPRPEGVEVENDVVRGGNDELQRAETVGASAIASRWIPAPALTPEAYEPMATSRSPRRGAGRTAGKQSAPRLAGQRGPERERDHGDHGHAAEVAGRQPACERCRAHEAEPHRGWLPRGGDEREHQEREHLEVRERGVLGAREVPGEDDEDDAGPQGNESAEAEVTHQEVHRGSREDVTGERNQVVGRDRAEQLGREIGRVVRQ